MKMFSSRKEASHIEDIKKCMSSLSELLINMDFDPSYQQIIKNTAASIDKPIVMAVIGEVNSGKSSFINSLIQENVCFVDEAPCTDCICELSYGEAKSVKTMTDERKNIVLTNNYLKNVTIIDTPACNSTINQHNDITNRYIPNADIIIAVFSAKNPFGQSIWSIISNVYNYWNKKIILVLQQADLVKSSDLQQNMEYVKDHAIKIGIKSPIIFAVSSKTETTGKVESSGFAQIREYIEENIFSESAQLERLKVKMATVNEVISRVEKTLENDNGIHVDRVSHKQDADFKISDLVMKNDVSSQELLDRFEADYTETVNETEKLFSEIIHVKARVDDLRNKKAFKTWLHAINTKLCDRTNRLIKEFSHDLIDDFERLNKRIKVIYSNVGNETNHVHEHEINRLVNVKHANEISKIKTESETLVKSSCLIDYIGEVYGKKFENIILIQKIKKWFFYLIPIIIMLVIVFGPVVIDAINQISEPQKVVTENTNLITSVAIEFKEQLVDLRNSIAGKNPLIDGPFKIGATALIVLSYFIYLKIIRSKSKKKLIMRIEVQAKNANDYFTQHKEEIRTEFRNHLKNRQDVIVALYKSEFDLLKAHFGSNSHNSIYSSENVHLAELRKISERWTSLKNLLN